MLYAREATGERIAPAPGRIGHCPSCGARLRPKCGKLKIHHWSHAAGDCDAWSEGETDWHRGWKQRATKDWCEVTIGPHRADIRRPDGMVIELQHSPIAVSEIQERESFYGNMVWLFDASSWRAHAEIYETVDNRVLFLAGRSARPSLGAVSKPLYLDLGGPILFCQELGFRARRGYGHLLSRSAFLERVGLLPMHDAERNLHSHYSLEWQKPYQHHWAEGPNRGQILLTPEAVEKFRGFDSDSKLMLHSLCGAKSETLSPTSR